MSPGAFRTQLQISAVSLQRSLPNADQIHLHLAARQFLLVGTFATLLYEA